MTINNASYIVYLKKDRAYPFLHHHPWLFAGAIHRIEGTPNDGDEVTVRDTEGNFIAYGLFNSQSQIRVRLYSWNPSAHLDEDFWKHLIQEAISLRKDILYHDKPQDAIRLISSEGDNLSGLTVDSYGGYLVVQFTSLALFQRKDAFISILTDILHPKGIYLRTEKDIREEEGLIAADGLLSGVEPQYPLLISENAIDFEVSLQTGQKTGFYLDQRENRFLARLYAKGRKCLDMCCYTGGFALNMASGGASSILAVDVSSSALDIAQRNAERNGFRNISFLKGDAFKTLQHLLESGEKFDMIVLDPPKFSRSKAAHKQALNGYRNLNETAMRLLNDKGILFTCSCSGRVSREEFYQVLQESAKQANVSFQLLEQRGAAPDHPISIYCPESQYLKCLVGVCKK
ncbi:MAG TPA: class I SAM-dependent rRNA methyltransferase [Candidatus Cloacimonadota bacterium]|nr:class I SAM-dependent rRNA methyltransferase [Candidatus Cloacimonadota bacterium]HPT71168.1 class I SAM-dependent rRNA methyltransferase [Candidatus Cloacimonadota bacterium]